jgi:thiol:disulfide interchange protein DsbA
MRALNRCFAAALALVAVGLAPRGLAAVAAPAATADPYQLNKQYVEVNQAVPPADLKKVKVEEFFWFGCPHCRAFEPSIEGWLKKKPDYVNFERVPNSLGRPMGELHQRAFYVAQVLGVEDKIVGPMFDGLQKVEEGDTALTTPADIDALFVKVAGVKPGSVSAMLDNFAVDGKVQQADQLAMGYGVTGTPTVVVDGRWLTDLGKAGGDDGLIKVVQFLCDKARKERGIAAK